MTDEESLEAKKSGWIAGRLEKLRGRPLRFLIAGGLNTLVGLTAYPILLWSSAWFYTHYLVALLVVQVFCLCFAFTTYKVGVFRTRGNIVSEFVRFSSYYMGTYAVNWLVLPALVEGAKIDPIIAQYIYAFIVLIGSYFWHSSISFKTSMTNSSEDQPAEPARTRV
jgi:putative flippase GtrA